MQFPALINPKLLLLIWMFASAIVHDAAARQPNVILILADDMAVGDLSCFNGGISRTPHLDRLKSQSVWFRQAYSASPVCAPARAALLTGRYPHRTGVVTLNMEKYPELTRLRKDEVTVADLFRGNGYTTGMIGKWHCGSGAEYHPLARGFDEFEGFIGHRYVPSYFRYRLDIQRETISFAKRYLTADLSARAVNFVQRHRDEPFFLHLAHYAPHRPVEAPEDRIKPFIDAGIGRETATVYAMIEIMDEGIGELLDELDRLQLDDETIVIFASDNGPDPLVESRFNLDLRGTKYTVNEGGIRVPLMIRWPARLQAGENDSLVHFTDLLPTLIGWCGLRVSEELKLDGREIPIEPVDSTGPPPPARFWQWNRAQPRYSHNAAVREGRWKLVRPFVTKNLPVADSKKPPALYDLLRDPGEKNDLSAQHRNLVRRMNTALEAWCREVDADRRGDSR